MSVQHDNSITIRISSDWIRIIEQVAQARRERKSVIVREFLYDSFLLHGLVPSDEVRYSQIGEEKLNRYQIRKESSNHDRQT